MRARERRRLPRAAIVTIEITVFVALFAAVVFGLGYARDRLDRMVGRLREQVSVQVADRLGARVRYGEVSRFALRTLQVSDLELLGASGDVLLSARRLRVHYSLRTLLSTRSAVDAVNRVELTGVVANLQLSRDQGPVSAALGGVGAAAAGAVQPLVLPWPLTIADARVTVTAGSDRLDLRELSLRLEPDGDGVRIVDARARLDAALAGVAGHEATLDTRIRVDGRLGPGREASRTTVRVGDVQSNLGTLPALEVQAAWDGTTISLTALPDDRGSVLRVWIEPERRLIRADLRAEQLHPLGVVRPEGPLRHLRPWFDTTVSGTATVIAGPAGVLSYDADVDFVAPPASLGELPPGPVEVDLSVQGDGAIATFAPLVLRSAGAAARYDGTIDTGTGVAVGRLAVTGLDPDGRPIDASAEVEADLQERRLTLEEGAAAIGDVAVTELAGRVALSGAASDGAAAGASPSLQVALTGVPPDSPDGTVAVTGSVTLGPRPAFAGRVDLENLDAGVLYGLLRPADADDSEPSGLTDGLIVSAQLEGSVGPDLLTLKVSAASVVQRDGPLRARFDAVATERALEITDLDLVVGASTRAVGSATLDAERLSFSGEIEMDGERVPGTIRLETGDGVTVRGPWGLVQMWPDEKLRPADVVARIAETEEGRPAPFRLNMDGYPLAALGGDVTADAGLAGTVERPWAFLGSLGPGRLGAGRRGADALTHLGAAGVVLDDSRLVLRGLSIGDLPAGLDLEFGYDDNVLTADRIRFAIDDQDVTGTGTLNVTTVDGFRAAGQVLLESGQERYDASVSIVPGRIDVDVDVNLLRLDRLVPLPIPGTASGRIRITGSLAQPVIAAELTSYDVPLNEDYVTLALQSTYDGQRITIDDLAVHFRDHRIRGVAGSIDMSSGAVAVGGRYEGEYLGQPLSLDLAVTGTASFPAGSAPERSLPAEAALAVSATGVTVGGLNKPSWDATLRWEERALAFSGGPLDGLSGRVATDGSFEIAVSAPLPLQGTASGTLSGSELSADLSIAALDLTLLNDLMHTSAVTVVAGSAAGSVRLDGPIDDPEMRGALQATGVVLESSLIPQRIGPLAFPVAAGDRELTVERTRPERGVAPVEVSGTVRFGQWAPVAYDFSVQTATGDGVPVDYRFGPISVAGIALGGVRITGDREATHVTGAVEADSARVFIDNAGRESPPAWEPLTVELAATTGRGVELTWPSEDLPILEALVDVDQTVSVSYDGFSGDYSVVGDVAIRRGELFFFNRTFVLRDGLVSFAEDEGRFDPRVTVRAETRERSPDDGTLWIYLDADSPLSALEPQTVRLSSEPTRPLPELRAMLGAPFANGTANEDIDLLAVAGGMATQFGVVRPMERALRDSLGLDLFSIRSQLVENLLRTPLGVSSPDLLDNTEIVVGKYLGDDLFFEALMRVESDTVSPVPALRTDLELSLEWATPFFLLEWSVLPSLTDPVQTGSALSLSWRFNY